MLDGLRAIGSCQVPDDVLTLVLDAASHSGAESYNPPMLFTHGGLVRRPDVAN